MKRDPGNSPMAHRAPRAALAGALVLGLLAASGAQAQSAGTWLVRLGATKIKPQTDSGDLSPPSFAGTKADVKADTEPSGGVSYMLTDNISVDVPIARRYKHDIVGEGAIAGVGKIGEVRSLPITVLGQYRFFDAQTALRPYLGAGATYAKFYKARSTAVLSGLTGGTPANPTLLSVDSRWGATVQAGVSYAFNPHWFADLNVTHTFVKTRNTLSTGQTLDITLDPNSLGLAIGYMF